MSENGEKHAVSGVYHPVGVTGALRAAGLSPRKSLGQNFFLNRRLLEDMVSLAGVSADDTVFEIGPGLGALTRVLARRAKKVVAVEIDEKLTRIARANVLDFENVRIVHGDFLKMDETAFLELVGEGPVRVASNLPYYATTPMLLHLLQWRRHILSMTVLVQKETVARLAASPGSKAYGALAVLIDRYARIQKGFDVPAAAFYPPPNVDSSVVHLIMKDNVSEIVDDDTFLRIVRAGLSMRRKTLANNLAANFGGVTRDEIAGILEDLGFSASVRGERLSSGNWEKLAWSLKKILQ
ncbi:MAG: 16S rRNA (adenine(1518)-N(6)/adenine(1519)-N(6))-dimethyltransferase RsmA [Christensenellales bacterium]|jgi:16S rRNA (adenine1518-N6/adenine1519-N6)-dimethyltransferase